MLPSTNFPSVGQQNYLTALENAALKLNSQPTLAESFWDNIKSLKIKNEAGVMALADWLSRTSLVDKLDYKLVPGADYFGIHHRVVLNFSLAENAGQFGLLRGLFSLGKPTGLQIEIDAETRIFNLEIIAENTDEVFTYLNRIFDTLVKESEFKKVLKQVLKFDKKSDAQRHEIQAELQLAS